jgi:hypothetical protein
MSSAYGDGVNLDYRVLDEILYIISKSDVSIMRFIALLVDRYSDRPLLLRQFPHPPNRNNKIMDLGENYSTPYFN